MKTRNLLKRFSLVLWIPFLLVNCGQPQDGTEDAHAGHSQAKPAPNPTGTSALRERDPERPWCAEHACYEADCFICHPELREPGRLWCQEHSCYEDRCWECHPDLQDKSRPFCTKHCLYEDECFLCHPELKGGASPAAASAKLQCSEHGVPEEECGICHPELTQKLAPGQGMQVRLPSPASAGLVGVETAQPTTGSMSEVVECLAEVSYNQNQLGQIVAPVGGIIQTVQADLGDRVEEKQSVAKLWSASIAEAVAKAVLTHQTLDRERRLHAQRVTSEKDLQEAEATHRAACQQLRTLGFTEEQIDELVGKPAESVYLEVRAPFAGEIVERMAVRGALVETGKPLFVVTDRSVMWANLSIPETALSRVQVGQAVELTVDALPGRVFVGKLTWIAPAVDERTRLARARAELPNPDGVLRDKMFARARIVTRRTEGALLVPSSAIQRVLGHPLVFVKKAEDLFEARAIQLGATANGQQEVLNGLQTGEPVVVTRGFAVKSQLLISRLGAGCADD